MNYKLSDGTVGQANVGADNGLAVAKHGKDHASSSLFAKGSGEDLDVVGGVANYGSNRGVMHNTGVKDGNKKSADFTEDGGLKLNTFGDNFDHEGSEVFHADAIDGRDVDKFVVDPDEVNKRDGEGGINWVDHDSKERDFKYTYKTNGVSNGKASLVEVDKNAPNVIQQGFFNAECTAVENSEQVCYKDGKRVGKVVYANNGDCTVFPESDIIPLARCSVRCPQDKAEKCIVTINEGLLQGNMERLRNETCFNEAAKESKGPAGQRNKYRSLGDLITIENMEFNYNSQDRRGNVKINWPDCFKMSADITLPAGLNLDQLELQFNVQVLPAGNLQCMDPAICGARSCYYCDPCGKQFTTLNMTSNTDTNVCDSKTSKTVRAEATVCPYPKDANMAMCASFDRSLIGNDYYKYDGEIKTEIRLWYGPDYSKKVDQYEKYNNSITYLLDSNLWKAEFKQFRKPHPVEVRDFYIQRTYPSYLLKCQRGLVDFNVGGTKFQSSVMLDWFTQLSADQKIKLFKEPACKDVTDLWYEQLAAEDAKRKASGGGGGGNNWLSQLGNAFGGFGG
jgi:hypothetical protein